MKENIVYDWGQAPPLAPSTLRVNPLGWIGASAGAGAVAAMLALALVWRPFPGLPLPVGALAEHMASWIELAAHAIWKTAFSYESQAYRKQWAEMARPEQIGLIWRCAIAIWASCMPAIFLAKPFLRPRDGLIHLRGSFRHEGAEATKRLVAALAARVKRRPDHEIAPGVAYSADMWTRHVLVVGGVGSGKSTAIKPLIEKIVEANEQMLLFDPKSEFTIGFKKPALLAPWDKRSLSWDIARDMRNQLDMRRFAATMIRESQDPMWSNASRQLLVGLMIYLKSTRGNDWGWMELRDLVALPQTNLLLIMKEWHPEAVRAVEKASVTTAGILINLSSFCAAIFDLAEAWGMVPPERRVSFVEWTQGRSRFPQIILQGHGAYADLTKSYVEGIVGIVSAMVNSVEMEDDPKRKIWFVADEFVQMGKIPVRPLFEVGRSRGVRCVVACQDLSQVEELYGAPMVKALVGMCGTLLIGQTMQGETAEQLCKAFGAREVERANLSSSYGGAGGGPNRSTTLSFNRDEVSLYKPSELSSRLGLTPDGTGVKMILFTGGHAYELFWPHYQIRRERMGHVPAPWTLGFAVRPQSGGGAPRDAVASFSDSKPDLTPSPTPPSEVAGSEVGVVGEFPDKDQATLPSDGPHPAVLPGSSRGLSNPDVSHSTIMDRADHVDDPASRHRLEVRAAHVQDAADRPVAAEFDPAAEATADHFAHMAGLEALSTAMLAAGVLNVVADFRSGPREEVVPMLVNGAPPKDVEPTDRKPRRSELKH